MTIQIVRDVDGTTIKYDREVPDRGLVAVMREEQLLPGTVVSSQRVPEVTTHQGR